MRRFQFRLESVLRVRRFREEQAQLSLAAAQRRLAEEEEVRAKLLTEIQKTADLRGHGQIGKPDITELVRSAKYEDSLRADLDRQEIAISNAASEVEFALDTLRRAHSDSEVVEKLREKRLTEYYQESLASEQQAIDENAVLRWNGNGKG